VYEKGTDSKRAGLSAVKRSIVRNATVGGSVPDLQKALTTIRDTLGKVVSEMGRSPLLFKVGDSLRIRLATIEKEEEWRPVISSERCNRLC
jgi:hypothetical protein